MYFQTSNDILNITLAGAVLIITVLLAWLLIYLLRIIRPMVLLLQSVAESMRKLDHFFEEVKIKLENSASYLSLITVSVKELISFLLKEPNSKRRKK